MLTVEDAVYAEEFGGTGDFLEVEEDVGAVRLDDVEGLTGQVVVVYFERLVLAARDRNL